MLFEKYICLRILLSGVREGYFILVKTKGQNCRQADAAGRQNLFTDKG